MPIKGSGNNNKGKGGKDATKSKGKGKKGKNNANISCNRIPLEQQPPAMNIDRPAMNVEPPRVPDRADRSPLMNVLPRPSSAPSGEQQPIGARLMNVLPRPRIVKAAPRAMPMRGTVAEATRLRAEAEQV